jgi:signal transduction histidine kinase
MTTVEFGELVEGLSETVGYRRAREVVEEATEAVGLDRRNRYPVDRAERVCEHVAEAYDPPLSLAARSLHDRVRVRQLDERATDAPSLFENAVDPAVEVVFTAGGAVIRRTNDRFAEAFDLDAERVAGERFADLPVPPVEPGERRDLLQRLRTGETLDIEVSLPVPEADRGTGEGPDERVFRLRGIGALHDDEVTTGYLVYTEVTERRHREAKLERRNEHLEAFATLVSHDLRNPLGIAQGYLDLAREEADVPHAADMEEALKRMDDIIEEMLVLARGSQTISDPEAVEIAGVAREAWRHVETGDATLVVEATGNVRSDHNRLLHVFENCYRNSVEHAPDDHVPTVWVRADEDALYITDDGPGIPPAERERVLEAGYSSDPEGTGLGLYIVREIAEAHGWTLELGDAPEGGLEVALRGVERL